MEQLKDDQVVLRRELADVTRDLRAARRTLAAAKTRLRRQQNHGIVVNFQQVQPAVPVNVVANVPPPAAPAAADDEDEDEEI